MVAAVRLLLRFLGNLLRVLLSPLQLMARGARRKRRRKWVFLKLPEHLTELRGAEPTWRRLLDYRKRNQLSSIEELRELVEYLERDPEPPGLFLQIGAVGFGWAACESVRELLQRVRASGKRVICYLAEGGGNRELYLASIADRIALVPWSSIGPLGFAIQSVYLKRLLSRLGVQVDVQATGPYKSAAEPLVLDAMSDAAREQQTALLGGMQQALERALVEVRTISPEALKELFSRGMLGARDAQRLGLVDELRYEDELRGLFGDAEPEPQGDKKTKPTAPWRSANGYLAECRFRVWQPMRDVPYVGVVSVTGTITDAKRPLMRRGADRGSVVAAIRRAVRDPRIRAVVLHVDSPGGSAFASELIHHEVERLAKQKPVIAYFGNVAASGGYYVASACRSIVARSLSVTGSIGVVSAKPAIADLLDRVGVNAETLRTAPHADMMSTVRPLSPDELRVLNEHTRELYARFLEVVSVGRKRPVEEIEALAGGRVWSGAQAREHGLVDVIGGIDRALELARASVDGMPPDQRDRLKLRACTAKPEPGQLPPTPESKPVPAPAAIMGGWVDDLAFLVASLGEPGAYYAWGLSRFLGVRSIE
jgi:protease IV